MCRGDKLQAKWAWLHPASPGWHKAGGQALQAWLYRPHGPASIPLTSLKDVQESKAETRSSQLQHC
jgi:hypothetical protein